MRVDATSYAHASEQVVSWSRDLVARFVCVANIHMTMECFDSVAFRRVVNSADLITPDGMPLVWALRLLGVRGQSRVYGPTLMLHVCKLAAREDVAVGFYGGSPEGCTGVVREMKARFPDLEVAYAYSPPFRALTPAEDATVVADIVGSGARILFVGLGCPKQELWMAEHKDRLPLVQLGVGAAFDFHSGLVKQAPAWLQNIGMEWAFRLAMEPRRLWKRYFKHNPRFVFLFTLQLLGLRKFDSD